MIAPTICKKMLDAAIAVTSISAKLHVAWEKGDKEAFSRLAEECEVICTELQAEVQQANMDFQEDELETFDTTQ